MSEETLTLEKLTEIVEKYPPLPYKALTFSPSGWAAFQSQIEPVPGPPFIAEPPGFVSGVPYAVLNSQTEDCIEYNDELLFRAMIWWNDEQMRKLRPIKLTRWQRFTHYLKQKFERFYDQG